MDGTCRRARCQEFAATTGGGFANFTPPAAEHSASLSLSPIMSAACGGQSCPPVFSTDRQRMVRSQSEKVIHRLAALAASCTGRQTLLNLALVSGALRSLAFIGQAVTSLALAQVMKLISHHTAGSLLLWPERNCSTRAETPAASSRGRARAVSESVILRTQSGRWRSQAPSGVAKPILSRQTGLATNSQYSGTRQALQGLSRLGQKQC